jgi:quercetin dioxygenase-like cupin family protein
MQGLLSNQEAHRPVNCKDGRAVENPRQTNRTKRIENIRNDAMKLLAILTTSLSMMASGASLAQEKPTVKVTPVGSQPSAKGPADYFTGSVRVDALFQGTAPARVGGGTVTFEPGARTAWHTHPLGQTLIVTAGSGRVQEWGGPIQEIKPGDTVWIPPNVKHWHGATATTGMTHIAIAESLDGKAVDWLEQVNDQQYVGRP